ncbi:hypothetical protein QG37_07174 [Candidozyma auris]|uniref:Uncharacterized protein n=1 Tax=Candidozyma auris TaxID=498019 RepID=A0A0L0NQK2_CANAR|nr:hypothetical protein QG37_07174 [[Candida] auris]
MKNPRRDIRKAGCKIAADGNGKKKKKIKREERLEKKKKKILQPVTNSHPRQVWFCPGFKSEQGFGEAVPKY